MRKWQNDRDVFCRCIYIVDGYNQTQNKTKKGPFILHIPEWWVSKGGDHIKYCAISD